MLPQAGFVRYRGCDSHGQVTAESQQLWIQLLRSKQPISFSTTGVLYRLHSKRAKVYSIKV